jgi:hypothetical protein
MKAKWKLWDIKNSPIEYYIFLEINELKKKTVEVEANRAR